MNLAIEYLKRSGDIQNFLKFPCSLFLENFQEERIVVGIHESDQDKVCITKWLLSECNADKKLPPRKKSTINRDFVFQSRQVSPKGFQPIQYQEQPPPSYRNSYKQPMDEGLYLQCLENALNSYLHRRYRENWLWKAFSAVYGLYSRYNFLKTRLRRDVHGIIATEEQSKIKGTFLWDRWVSWKKNMLWEQEVASELIFSFSSSSSPLILLYGAEDNS